MRGATGRILKDLARSLAVKGWKVSVVTTADAQADYIDKNVQVFTVKGVKRPKRLWGYLTTYSRLYKRAASLPPHDIIVSLSDPPLSIFIGNKIAAAKKKPPCPLVS